MVVAGLATWLKWAGEKLSPQDISQDKNVWSGEVHVMLTFHLPHSFSASQEALAMLGVKCGVTEATFTILSQFLTQVLSYRRDRFDLLTF
jgi:hypothetical protein